MTICSSTDIITISRVLASGELVVMPTDTVYGILASAQDAAAIQRLYRVRQRNRHQPCIVLVSSVTAIPNLTAEQRRQYQQCNAQRPTTLVTPVPPSVLPMAVRHNGTVAFRVVPARSPLATVIRQAGPVLAPSANLPGQPPARTIADAIAYFGHGVTLYADGGPIPATSPSRIVRFVDNQLAVLRN